MGYWFGWGVLGWLCGIRLRGLVGWGWVWSWVFLALVFGLFAAAFLGCGLVRVWLSVLVDGFGCGFAWWCCL